MENLCIGDDQQMTCAGNLDHEEPTVLCIDMLEGIQPLLTSALYHRLAHGLHSPMVGIACEPSSTVVRVIVGWLDERTVDGEDLVSLRAASVPCHALIGD